MYSPGVPPPVRGQGFLGPGQSVAIITPGAGGYGGGYGYNNANIGFSCKVNYRGQVVDLNLYRQNNGYNNYNGYRGYRGY